MKTFGYTARDHSGALKSGTVTAGDRAEALAALKARQLVPVSVTEGAQPRSGAARRFDAVWISRAVLVIALVAVGTFVMVEFAVRQKGRPAGSAVKPAAANKAPPAVKVVKPPAVLPPAEKPAPPPVETAVETPAPPAVVAVTPQFAPPLRQNRSGP